MPKIIQLQVFLVILLASKFTFAQKRTNIEGTLKDSTSIPVIGANISLILEGDTVRTISNEKGEFNFTNVENKKLTLLITNISFKKLITFLDLSLNREQKVLVPIVLYTDQKKLNEVVIKPNKPKPIVFKKDTIEYDANAYKVYENDKVDKLIRQLPGIEVDKDGNATSEGKPISKLRVNGVDFFTGNLKEFINQLPANIFDKIQIIQDYGDEAKFNGVKKGEPIKLLNLVTKPGMNFGNFGSINASLGSDKRYGTTLNGNYWKDVKQVSVMADLNTVKNIVGVNNTNRINLTYNNSLTSKLKVTNNLSYSNSKSSSSNSSYSETINSLGTIYNNISNVSKSGNNSFGLNSTLNYNPKQTEYIRANINIGLNYSSSDFDSNSQQYGIIKQGLTTNSNLFANTPNSNLALYYGRKLNTQGRIIIASLLLRNNYGNNEQQVNNDIRYYNSTGFPVKDSILNRILTNQNTTKYASLNITYSEPFSKSIYLDLSYSYTTTHQKTDFVTNLSIDPYPEIRIDSLSNNFNSTLSTNNIGIDLRYNKEKLSLLTGVNLQVNTLSQHYVDYSLNATNSVKNYSPILNLNYVQSKSNSIDLNYSGSSSPPTFEQLQLVKDSRNLQNIIVGNPNLKPAFNHSLNSTIRHSGKESGQLLTISLGGSIIQNQIVNNTSLIKDTLGSYKQITNYLNANGSYSLNSNYNWSYPFKVFQKTIRVSLAGVANYNYGIVYTNDVKSYNIRKLYSQAIRATSYLKKLSFEASAQYQNTTTKYFIGQGLFSSIQNLNFALNSTVYVYKSLTFTFEGDKRINQGYEQINVNNPLIINLALAQSIFKKNPITISVQAFDLFNQFNRISQTVLNNTIINNRSDVVSRYLIFKLSVPFSKFAKPK